jgi:hypothetical protein
MTYDGLVEAVEKTGMSTEGLTEEQLIAIGKTLGLEVPLRVEVVEYTNKRGDKGNYVKTSGFPFTGSDGKQHEARGLFLRVETVDQAIEALQTAKQLLAAEPTDGEA